MFSRLIQRFRSYRMIRKRRNARPDAARIKAQEAEDFVAKLLRQFPQVKSVHTSKLIPDPDRYIGSGETDIIAVTDRAVFAIECKNYAGAVIKNGEDISQQRLLDNGRDMATIPKIEKKADHLKRHLNSVTNSGNLWVQHLVVLCNEFGEPTEDVLNMPHIADCFNLLDKLESLANDCEALDEDTLNSITAKIDDFAEYDKVIFDGGKVFYGHIIKLPEEWDRSEYSSISVSPPSFLSSMLNGTTLSVKSMKWNGEIGQHCVGDSPVIINIPWEKGVKHLRLSDVKEVIFGTAQENKSPSFNSLSSKNVPLSNSHQQSLKKILTPSAEEYSVGDVLKGRTIVKHLGDEKYPHSMLVELSPGKRPGIINTSCLGSMDSSFFQFFYARGKQIDVKVSKIKHNGDVSLILADGKEMIL